MTIHQGNLGEKMKEFADLENMRLQNQKLKKEIGDFKRIKTQSTITMWIAIALLVLKGIELLMQQ